MTKRVIICVLLSCFIFGTALSQQKDTAASLVRQGQSQLDSHNYADAITSFNAALNLNPNRSQQTAATEGLVSARTGRAQQLFNQAQEMHNNKRYPEAIELYNNAYNIAPARSTIQSMVNQRRAEAQTAFHEQRENEQQTAQAQERATREQAARERAEQSKGFVQRAHEHFIAGRYDDARDDYELAITVGGLTDAETADARRLTAEIQEIKTKIEFYDRPLKDDDFDIAQMGTSVTITKYKATESKTVRIGNTNHTVHFGITNVVIPATLYNIRVTKIGPNAFRNAGITNLTMPNTITEIGMGAFSGNKLQNVMLSTELLKIEGGMSPGGILEPVEPGAFEGNTGLTSIRIPDKVTEIGARAFKDCGLTTLQLGAAVSVIKESAFRNNKLTVVNFPVGARNLYAIRIVHRNAFRENQITNLVLPQGIEIVYDNAFTDNPMESLSLPASLAAVITIDNQPNQPRVGGNHTQFTQPLPSFPNSLTRITLPANMVDANLRAFENEPNLSGLRNLYVTAQPAQGGQRALPARAAGLYVKNGPVWIRQP